MISFDGFCLDIVPNHMAITGTRNRWWWDVLENGPSSVYASYFDVEWKSPEERLSNKILVPVQELWARFPVALMARDR